MSNRNGPPSSKLDLPPSSRIAISERPNAEARERDRASLKELAKFAQTPAPSSVGVGGAPSAAAIGADDSGMVDLQAIVAADPHGAFRAQSTPLASTSLLDDAAAAPPPARAVSATPPTMPSAELLAQGAMLAPPSAPFAPNASALGYPGAAPQSVPPGHVSAPPSHVSAPPPFAAPAPVAAAPFAASPAVVAPAGAPKKGGGGKVILAAFGGLALLGSAAAAVGFYVLKPVKLDPIATKTVDIKPFEPPKTELKPTETKATEPAVETKPADKDEGLQATNDLPTTPVGAGATKHASPKGGGAKVAAVEPPPAEPKVEAPKVEKPVVAAKGGPTTGLGEAMKQAAGPVATAAAQEEKSGGPAYAAGTVPQKPSQGQVVGAIGAVLPNARACLGPDDPVSKANVVFQSNGSVQSVSVSGAAAGKPAEACIKNALKLAKVGPFMDASFSFPVTVRP